MNWNRFRKMSLCVCSYWIVLPPLLLLLLLLLVLQLLVLLLVLLLWWWLVVILLFGFLGSANPFQEFRLGISEVPEHLCPSEPVQQQFFSPLALFVGTLALVGVDVVQLRLVLEVVPLDSPRNPTTHGGIHANGDWVFSNLDDSETDPFLV